MEDVREAMIEGKYVGHAKHDDGIPGYAYNYLINHSPLEDGHTILYFGSSSKLYCLADRPKKPSNKFMTLLKDRLKPFNKSARIKQCIDYTESNRRCKEVMIWYIKIY